MSEIENQTTYNRWFVVIGAVIIQLALGTIYTWGALTLFVSPFLNEPETTTVYIFGVGLLSFAITMILAGSLQQKIGPIKTAIIGGIVLGVGEIFSALVNTFLGMLITHGIIAGAGIGLGYVCPIATAAKWFPDKKGLINGIAVAGFGAGAFIFNFIIKALANPLGIEVTDPNFKLMVTQTIPPMFIILGVIYMVMVIGGALTLRLPPSGYKPAGWEPSEIKKSGIKREDFIPLEMIKTPQFWMLWVMFILSTISGLMVIGSYAKFAKATEGSNFLYPIIAAVDFALVGGIAALFNGLGRIVWGKFSDIITYKRSMLIMFTIQGILMIVYFFTNLNDIAYFIATILIFFCFGGNFSLFPTGTDDNFGTKNLGANYGIMFTAYGIAGFLGATMVQAFVNAFGSYLYLFVVMGLMSIIAAIINLFLKSPERKI